ncbi:MAG TPA: hypothetical protein VOA19_06720, partial [Actinomycetes bacterium]|nr:hypothetical protein [Actinomycetes bacterium]
MATTVVRMSRRSAAAWARVTRLRLVSPMLSTLAASTELSADLLEATAHPARPRHAVSWIATIHRP